MSIQGQTLEVRVVGCSSLKDTKWISRQNPYVSIEYGGSKFNSTICTDGSTNPNFQGKNRITLIEGLRELNVTVWSSNTLTYDNLIGSGRVQLQKVLFEGFDDTAWTILSKTNRYAGEVCLVMHYSNANKPQPQPQYFAVPPPQPQYFAVPPQPQCCAAPPPVPQPQYFAVPPQPQCCAAPPPVPQPQYFAVPPQPQCCAAPPPVPQPQVPIYYAPPPAAGPPQPSMYPPQYPPQAYAPQSYPPQPYSPQCCPPSPSHAYPPQN